MRRKIILSGTPDGDPIDPINGCFVGRCFSLSIRGWKHKSGASGFSSAMSVSFEHNGASVTREVVLQHPFSHPLEKRGELIKQKRGERWLSLVESLSLQKDETKVLCENFFAPIVMENIVLNWGDLSPNDQLREKREKAREVSLQIEESTTLLSFLHFDGIGRECWVQIRDATPSSKYPDHRFLTERGFDHNRVATQTAEPTQPIVVEGEAPQDFWTGADK